MIEQTATYSPEDNKLRLYIGRVPREEYLKLRSEGWKALHKQRENGGGDFVAIWTPSRRNTALAYGGGVILDEDQGPAERAADRAERFSGYRDKRTTDATGHADRFDSGPTAHGYQSQARAERAAARHDRIGDRATDAWSKAEYWQRRTAGVISHALYKSTPGVRMGRIKIIEAELRKLRAGHEEYKAKWDGMKKIEAMTDADEQNKAARQFCGNNNLYSEYMHPRIETVTNPRLQTHPTSLYTLLTMTECNYGTSDITGAEACALFFSDSNKPNTDTDWTRHLELRLAYENQMCEAAGGRAALVEMIPGGFLGTHQIVKVNKSAVTGQVVSVCVMAKHKTYKDGQRVEVFGPVLFNIERLQADAYRPPTPEELTTFTANQKAEKEARPKVFKPSLINPTDEDAKKLQAIWNTEDREPSEVLKMTQAQYAAHSGGNCETVVVSEHGTPKRGRIMYETSRAEIFKVRRGFGGGFNKAYRVVILTDKPQKPLPWDALKAARDAQPTEDTMRPKLEQIAKELCKAWYDKDNRQILDDAAYIGWVSIQSMSQISWTAKGAEAYKAFKSETVNA